MAFNVNEVDGVVPVNGRFPIDISSSPHDLGGDQHLGILRVDQLPGEVILHSEHTSDPHTMLIDGRDVSVDGEKLDTIEVGAEVNNITDQQANSLTSGAHSNWHHHDDFYYRKNEFFMPGLSQVNWLNLFNVPTEFNPISHNHDDLYYTQAQADALVSNFWSISDLEGGALDTRYFTEGEITTNYYDKTQVDTIIASLPDPTGDYVPVAGGTFTGSVSVNGSASIGGSLTITGDLIVEGTTTTVNTQELIIDDNIITINSNQVGIPSPALISGIEVVRGDEANYRFAFFEDTQIFKIGEIGFEQPVATREENPIDGGFAVWNSSINMFKTVSQIEASALVSPVNISLTGDVVGSVLFDGSTDVSISTTVVPSEHNHDDRYFTELEITTNYYNKAQLNTGQLDSRYYTETEVNNLLLLKSDSDHEHDDLYYRKQEVDALASTYSLIGHNHDERYYQKVEVNAFLAGKADSSHTHDDRYFTETEIGSQSGISGAKLTGVSFIGGMTSTNVQDALQELYNNIETGGGGSGSLESGYLIDPEIDTTTSPVIIDATASTSAPLQLTNLTQPPTTGLAAGQIAIINGEMYIFNLLRNKWLTPTKMLTFGKSGSVDGHLLYITGGSSNDASGYKLSRNGTMTSFTLHSVKPIQNKDVYIRLNGSTVFTGTSDVNGDVLVDNLNVDFTAGDILSVQVSSAESNMKDVSAIIEFGWRA